MNAQPFSLAAAPFDALRPLLLDALREGHEVPALNYARAIVQEAAERGIDCTPDDVLAQGSEHVETSLEIDRKIAAGDFDGLHPFRAVTVRELLDAALPEREVQLDPWLHKQALCMVFAPRGTGKTHFSLGVAYALWSGGQFLGWQAARPLRVLFIDGEMPATVLQERLRAIMQADSREGEIDADTFRIITPDLLDGAPPDLASPDDQARLQRLIDDFKPDIIIADNISTLVRSRRSENDAESWIPVQEWALRMRQQGRSVLFIHHAGKGGAQRGTSKREDVLDVVLALRRPGDYTPEQGARFEVHFEKARHLHGDNAKPFEASLQTGPDGRQLWALRSLEDSTLDRAVTLARDGLTQSDIAEELGVHKSNVSRALKKARQAGLLPAEGQPC